MARTNHYDHFCPVARALEVIGEKWSLLIVRELLAGPRRFTDLERGLPNITAKWLTLRLRDLEAAGLVRREQEAGRREVVYTLTASGLALRPVIGALNAWGFEHAMRPAEPGEAIHPARLARSFATYLTTSGIRRPRPLGWRLVFEDGPQDIWFDGDRWTRQRVEEPALTATTDTRRWTAMLSRGPGRLPVEAAVDIGGDIEDTALFRSVLDRLAAADPAAATD